MPLSRRRFLELTAAASVASALPQHADARQIDPTGTGISGAGGGPLIVASRNGLRGVRLAYRLMDEEGVDPLDAAIEAAKIQELDPEDSSVGLGGLPNEDGVVQLDASCMHGPTKRAGAVAALEGIATPSLVAKAVMEHTDHVLLVGEGARRFALDLGFKEQNLLTDASRQAWLRWKAGRSSTDNWLDPEDEAQGDGTHGTINVCALDAKGDLGSVTTTSGLSWKIPGRAGDSPIIGAGQYCDNRVGAAGSTGRGEANLKVCGAFLVVEAMRQGLAPTQACLQALQRAVEMTEDRLLDGQGRPRFGLSFYAVSKAGEFGSATMYEPTAEQKERGSGAFAVADANGARLETMSFLYSTAERPR
jgi:N4-(beta-N-acetylglucosaminyl)-L-asparaginase